MTENTINKLPDIFKTNLCTLKKASQDTCNNILMCESVIKVINFDRIPKEYAKDKGWRGVPKSNDALYIDENGKWYFIEFKNGEVKKEEVYRKVYDSLIMLIEMKIVPDYNFCRKHIRYYLVYNSNKYNKTAESEARDRNFGYIFDRAKTECRLFGIDSFEKYLLEETHTYTTEEFMIHFVTPMEQQEGMPIH